MDIKIEPNNEMFPVNESRNVFFYVGHEHKRHSLEYFSHTMCKNHDDYIKKDFLQETPNMYDQKVCSGVKTGESINSKNFNLKVSEQSCPIKIEKIENTYPTQDLSIKQFELKSEDVQWINCPEIVPEYTCPVKIEKTEPYDCPYAEIIPDQVSKNDPGSSTLKINQIFNSSKPVPSKIKIEVEEKVGSKNTLKTEPVAVVILNKLSFHERNFVCNVCFDVFKSLESLTKHKISFHNECKLNSPHFKQKRAGSMIKSQKNDKLFKCEFCAFKSSRLFDMKQHKMTHTSEKPFKCDFCDFKSSRSFSLKTHTMLHNGELPFKCDNCDFKTARSHDLKRHKIMTHSGENSSQISTPREKPFKCDICDFMSSRSFTLKRHKMVHSGEKPLKCGHCDFKSARVHDLKRHVLSHTGDRPFACDHCDFKTARSYDLKRHKLLHNEMKRSTCDVIIK